jgi:hypothetical protein
MTWQSLVVRAYNLKRARPLVGRGKAMIVTLGPDLEAALTEQARGQGIAPELLALKVLRERFLGAVPPIQPRDEWERRLLGLAKDCGVSLSDQALSREELYD